MSRIMKRRSKHSKQESDLCLEQSDRLRLYKKTLTQNKTHKQEHQPSSWIAPRKVNITQVESSIAEVDVDRIDPYQFYRDIDAQHKVARAQNTSK